jgi:hypothetical protein
MVGFMCFVMGRLDPSEFFCGLQLTFGSHPHLVQLKQSVEERVAADGVVPDGGEYAVGDLEILDLRLNQWVPLDARSQLYSGCFVNAIRDSAAASAAGAVERAAPRPGTQVMGFALEARRLFDGLDIDGAGALSMRSLLRTLRHDVNYAIDLFSALDQRATGTVTFQDFMTTFNERDAAFWHELALRLEHGGRLPGSSAENARGSTLFMPSGTYAEQQRVASRREKARRRHSEAGSTTRTKSPLGGGHGSDGADDNVDAVAADVLSSFGDANDSASAAETAQSRLVPIPKVARPVQQAAADRRGESPGHVTDKDASADGTGTASPAPSPTTEQEEINKERARKVVSLLQSSIDRKRAAPQRSAMGQKVLSAIRQMRPRAGTPTSNQGGAASPGSANLSVPGSANPPRSPASAGSGPASPAGANSNAGRSARSR